MDRSWMYTTPRASKRYTNGVEYFLDFAFEKSSQNGTILCPCIDCQSLLFAKRAVVYDHLICSGFKRGYLYWKDHGEVHEAAPLGNRREDEGIYQHDMHGLLDDLFPTLPMEGNNADTSEGEENTSLNTKPVKNDGTKSNDLLKDVEQKESLLSLFSQCTCLSYRSLEVSVDAALGSVCRVRTIVSTCEVYLWLSSSISVVGDSWTRCQSQRARIQRICVRNRSA
ncbi:reverse transcriptase domain-containing protein [Tanacetum coccineum]